MPPPAYSNSFFQGALPAGTWTNVPGGGGKVIVVRDVEVIYNPAGGDYFLMGDNPTTTYFMVHVFGGSSSFQHWQWQGRLVLFPNQGFSMYSSGGTFHVAVSGYSLSAT